MRCVCVPYMGAGRIAVRVKVQHKLGSVSVSTGVGLMPCIGLEGTLRDMCIATGGCVARRQEGEHREWDLHRRHMACLL